MMLEIGQVLWLKLPFGKTDAVSEIYHPYLILSINSFGVQLVEAGQMDSENDHPWEVLNGKKIPVDNINPDETVIYKPSYLQTDRKIQIEYFEGLAQYLDTTDKLSQKKFDKIINGYYDKRQKYGSDNFRDMYFTEERVVEYNPIDEWKQKSVERKKKYGVS